MEHIQLVDAYCASWEVNLKAMSLGFGRVNTAAWFHIDLERGLSVLEVDSEFIESAAQALCNSYHTHIDVSLFTGFG